MNKDERTVELIVIFSTLLMILMFAFSGCSSTFPYTGAAMQPYLTEVAHQPHPTVGYMTENGPVAKTVYINNPFDFNVHVQVDCGWQSEWDIVVAPRTTQMLMAMTNQRYYSLPSCVMRLWTRTDRMATYK